jgi:hypothetical protein
MSSTETGYPKNAANFKDLIIRLNTLGDDYQPPKAMFELKALEQLSKNAEDAMRAVSQVLPVYSKAVDDQELIFKPLNNLITKSFNYLKAAIANPAELQTAKTIADGLRGQSKRKVVATDAPASTASTKRLSYDSKVENLKRYIEVLSASKIYTPKESDISIASLQALLLAMENSITAVAIAKTPLDDARKKRHTIFYAEQIGLVETVFGVKNYIKASLHQDHPERKHILALTFRKMS